MHGILLRVFQVTKSALQSLLKMQRGAALVHKCEWGESLYELVGDRQGGGSRLKYFILLKGTEASFE